MEGGQNRSSNENIKEVTAETEFDPGVHESEVAVDVVSNSGEIEACTADVKINNGNIKEHVHETPDEIKEISKTTRTETELDNKVTVESANHGVIQGNISDGSNQEACETIGMEGDVDVKAGLELMESGGKELSGQGTSDESLSSTRTEKVEPNVITDAEGDKGAEEKPPGFVSERVQLLNLPLYLSYKEMKKLIAKNVGGATARKIKCCKGKAFFSFSSVDEATNAIAALSKLEIKGRRLRAKYAKPEPLKGRDCLSNCTKDKETEEDLKTVAQESVTPLAHLPYSEQLKQKFTNSEKLLSALIKQLDSANVVSFKPKSLKENLEPIRPSPRIIGYRNKCEFTVGETLDGNLEVGFVRGKFTENQHYVVPINDCSNISDQMKRIVEYFKEFIAVSGYPPFNEFKREGVWRMLTIREFGCDVMIIATVFPIKDQKDEEILKKRFSESFLCHSSFVEKHFRVTSVYWQRLENASDKVVYENIGGACYVYETILGTRFRVSPGAFFQTNTAAAEVLYSTILEKCMDGEKCFTDVESTSEDGGTIKTFEKTDELIDDSEEPEQKKTKTAYVGEVKNTLFLDICCGTGTIGICILNSLRRKKMDGNVFLLGVELVESAVKDAIHNAHDNLLFEKQCCFIAGEASDIFQDISSHLPSGMDLGSSKVIGILDPPRGGVHDKVILGCRRLTNMRHLIYVSCHPSMASKNLTDLCRPTSKKYLGKPFCIESIVPVDLFPQTIHCEWVIKLSR